MANCLFLTTNPKSETSRGSELQRGLVVSHFDNCEKIPGFLNKYQKIRSKVMIWRQKNEQVFNQNTTQQLTTAPRLTNIRVHET